VDADGAPGAPVGPAELGGGAALDAALQAEADAAHGVVLLPRRFSMGFPRRHQV
jgi:hypothetical protein